jgi:succinoglycan biosynthesis protein ExoO
LDIASTDSDDKVALQDETDFWISPCSSPDRDIDATIIVPAYNTSSTLERALRSALSQTLTDIEVIVIDDASTDETWTAINRLMAEDGRLRSIRNKRNSGKPASMNRATTLARGRWLAVLDADDWYHPERLSTLIGVAEAAGADMVADNQFFYDAAVNTVVGTAWRPLPTHRQLTIDQFLSGSDAYEPFNLGMLKPIFRTKFLRRTGVTYDLDARHGQDFFILLRFFIAQGSAMIVDTPYYYYTQPFGMNSRRWSHPARKRYDFRSAHDINERYIALAHDSLSPRQCAQLRRRSAKLKALEEFHRLKERIAAHDIIGATIHAFRHPRMLIYCLLKIFGRFRARPGKHIFERREMPRTFASRAR